MAEELLWGLLGLAWMVLTGRRIGWARLRRVAAWPGERTVAVATALANVIPPHHRRRAAIYARVAWTRYRCWRHGVH